MARQFTEQLQYFYATDPSVLPSQVLTLRSAVATGKLYGCVSSTTYVRYDVFGEAYNECWERLRASMSGELDPSGTLTTQPTI